MLKQLLIAIDQLINVLFGGKADETLSARAYRNRNDGWAFAYRAINALFFLEDDHCKASYLSEVERKQLPSEYRTDARHN